MESNLEHLRHSAAHLLAAAVVDLYPNALPTIGPAVENGFYYDFDLKEPLTEADLTKIEQRMRHLVTSWDGFKAYKLSTDQALKEFSSNPYKQEMIDDLSAAGETITLYQSGDFRDLCRGGHIDNPRENLQHFKLLSVAGAYWRGDEKNKMLTRVYGTAFFTASDLDAYLKQLEAAKDRDHRKLGRQLGLFTFSDYVGSGLPLYTPKGALLRRLINNYIEDLQSAQGYTQVHTPQIAKAELFKVSGHYDKYKDDMFRVVSNYSDEEFFLKPMNCPQHTQIYASEPRSYRDLPLRLTDFAMLYRDEKPGELSGLARVRSFSQDDCHIFCTEQQVDQEIDIALTMIKEAMNTFGLKYRYRLSTRDKNHPEKYLGDPAVWDRVEAWAVQIMERNGIDYFNAPGEAAFYAPKMDLMATDALGRSWQLSTIQIDFVMPERFNLTYTTPDGTQKRPVMLHRAIVGSAERFLMILIEQFAGAFPVWLSPTQVAILPVSEKVTSYASKVRDTLTSRGIRAEIDAANESLGKKIIRAQADKTPYQLIVGEKEAAASSVSVRTRDGQTMDSLPLDQFLGLISQKIAAKSLEMV